MSQARKLEKVGRGLREPWGCRWSPRLSQLGILRGQLGLREDFCGWSWADFGEIRGLWEFDQRGISELVR